MELSTISDGKGRKRESETPDSAPSRCKRRKTRLVGAQETPDSAGSDTQGIVKVEAVGRFELALTAATASGVLLPCALVLELFAREWQQQPSNRAWLLLSCVVPLGYAARKAAHRVWREWGRCVSLRALIDSTQSSALFDAVVVEIETVAEAKNNTSASEMESSTMYDKKTGLTQVHLLAWAKEPHTVWLKLAMARELQPHGAGFLCPGLQVHLGEAGLLVVHGGALHFRGRGVVLGLSYSFDLHRNGVE